MCFLLVSSLLFSIIISFSSAQDLSSSASYISDPFHMGQLYVRLSPTVVNQVEVSPYDVSSTASLNYGPICSSENNLEDSQPHVASVICRSLGFSQGVFWKRNNNPTIFAPGSFILQNLSCATNSGDLSDRCSFVQTQVPSSQKNESSSVCSRTVAVNCTYGYSRSYQFRLTPSWRVETRKIISHTQGQVPVQYWNRICDDLWNRDATLAICGTLGFPFISTSSATNSSKNNNQPYFWTSESTYTSSKMYSSDDTTSFGIDNVQCNINSNSPSSSSFDSCSFSTNHNCLYRYETLVVDCVGNKRQDIPTIAPLDPNRNGDNDPNGKGSGLSTSSSSWGDGDAIGVKRESLLVFACGTLFMVASFVCCYKVMVRKRNERLLAIAAIRERRILGATTNTQRIFRRNGLLSQFGLSNNNNNDENDLDDDDALHLRQLQRQQQEHDEQHGAVANQLRLLEHVFGRFLMRNVSGGSPAASRNELDRPFLVPEQQQQEQEMMMVQRDVEGGTFMIPSSQTRNHNPDHLAIRGLRELMHTREIDNNNNNNDDDDNDDDEDVVETAILISPHRNTSPTNARLRTPSRIAQIHRGRIATPTLGKLTPRQKQRHNNNTSDDAMKEEENKSEEPFILPPRGYTTPRSSVVHQKSNNENSPNRIRLEDYVQEQQQKQQNQNQIAINGNNDDVSGVDDFMMMMVQQRKNEAASTENSPAANRKDEREEKEEQRITTTFVPAANTNRQENNNDQSSSDDENDHQERRMLDF